MEQELNIQEMNSILYILSSLIVSLIGLKHSVTLSTFLHNLHQLYCVKFRIV